MALVSAVSDSCSRKHCHVFHVAAHIFLRRKEMRSKREKGEEEMMRRWSEGEGERGRGGGERGGEEERRGGEGSSRNEGKRLDSD
eukprot:760403-Hanusia_phi.AAC.1